MSLVLGYEPLPDRVFREPRSSTAGYEPSTAGIMLGYELLLCPHR